MDDKDFRTEIWVKIRLLLSYWKEIERWIKIAEQVNKRAVIPAINELRYASRQLYYAESLLNKEVLSDGDKSSINKRLIIAEQYLENADHDVVDSIVLFYAKIVENLNNNLGISHIALHFPKYPLLIEDLGRVNALIAETRHDGVGRRNAYETIRNNDLMNFVNYYKSLQEAEVQARFAREQLMAELAQAQRKEKFLTWTAVISCAVTVVSLLFSVYVWLKT